MYIYIYMYIYIKRERGETYNSAYMISMRTWPPLLVTTILPTCLVILRSCSLQLGVLNLDLDPYLKWVQKNTRTQISSKICGWIKLSTKYHIWGAWTSINTSNLAVHLEEPWVLIQNQMNFQPPISPVKPMLVSSSSWDVQICPLPG